MAVPGTLTLPGTGGGVPGTLSFPGAPTFGGGGGKAKKKVGLLGQSLHIAGIPLQPVEHLVGDIGTAAVGLPLGLYAIGKTAMTNPADLTKYASAIVKQYEDYYGHDILHHLWDHPLQPILDGITVATLGAGSAVKLGQVAGITRLAQLGERTTLLTRSPEAILRGDGPVLERLSSNRPITKMREQVVNKMQRHILTFAESGQEPTRLQSIGRLVPGVGNEMKVWGKLVGDENIRKALKNSTPMRAYEKAFGKLSKEEKIALSARSMDIHPANLSEFWKDTKNGDELTPQVHDLMLNPTPKMVNAEEEARAVSQLGAELLKSRGVLSHESEIDRPGRFKTQVEDFLGHPVSDIHGDPYYLPHTTEVQFRRGSHPMEQVGGGKAEPKTPGSAKQNLGTLFAAGKLDLHNDVLGPEFLRRVKWLKFWGIHEGLKRGAYRLTWEELHQMDRSGRPPKGYDFLRTSVAHRPSDEVRVRLRKAEKTNSRRPNFHNAQRVQRLRQELHDYETGARPDPVTVGKQKIPFSVRGEGEHAMGTHRPPQYDASQIPDSVDLQRSPLVEHGFTTTDLALAHTDEAGRYFLVPKAASKAATGEFTRMSDFMYLWARRPLRVWRAALLGLRPAFFVNNLIGNGLMYAMKRGGTGATRDLFMAMRESHPDYVMKQLLKDPATPPEVRAQLMAEFFPTEAIGSGTGAREIGGSSTAVEKANLPAVEEQQVIPPGRASTGAPGAVEGPSTILPGSPAYEYIQDFYRKNYPEQMSGTMGLTQSPSTEGLLRGATSKVGRGWEATTSALPKFTSKVAEEGFRRGLIRNFIRTSPEFKAVYDALPAESRSFLAAARKLHEGEGGAKFQARISQQVDESLGNYTRLSPLERNALRNLAPFYAWYRAIVTTSFHLAVDNPLRAQILHKLGQIGAETALNQAGLLPLPSYLQGAIPLGQGPKGTQRVLATQSLNPWATLAQLGRGSTDDITSLGLNPFIIGALEAFKKLASAPGGATQAVSMQALVTEMMTQIVGGIPPAAQLHPKKGSKLYPNRGYVSSTEAWAGLPIKELNPTIAAQYAQAGQ